MSLTNGGVADTQITNEYTIPQHIYVDEIDEYTTNNGVDIDGVLLKDSNVTAGNVQSSTLTVTTLTTNGQITSQNLRLTNASNQITFNTGANPSYTFNVPAPTANRTITFPDVSTDVNVMYLEGTQSVSGQKNFNNIGIGSGVILLKQIYSDSLAVRNGSDTSDARVNASRLRLTNSSNQIEIIPNGTTPNIYITASNPAATRYYTIPDAGANSDFVMTSGTQSISGSKTFTDSEGIKIGSNLKLKPFGTTILALQTNAGSTPSTLFAAGTLLASASSNQIRLQPNDSGNYFDISCTNPAANRTYTLPDFGSNATFTLYGSVSTVSSPSWVNASGSSTLEYQQHGLYVFARITLTLTTSATVSSLTTSAGIPSGFIPSNLHSSPLIRLVIDGVGTSGYILFYNTGTLEVLRLDGSNINSGSTVTVPLTTAFYKL